MLIQNVEIVFVKVEFAYKSAPTPLNITDYCYSGWVVQNGVFLSDVNVIFGVIGCGMVLLFLATLKSVVRNSKP